MRIQKEFFDEKVYIPVEDVLSMLKELGLEQFYLNGSETSPPIRIPYNNVKQAVEAIYKRKK